MANTTLVITLTGAPGGLPPQGMGYVAPKPPPYVPPPMPAPMAGGWPAGIIPYAPLPPRPAPPPMPPPWTPSPLLGPAFQPQQPALVPQPGLVPPLPQPKLQILPPLPQPKLAIVPPLPQPKEKGEGKEKGRSWGEWAKEWGGAAAGAAQAFGSGSGSRVASAAADAVQAGGRWAGAAIGGAVGGPVGAAIGGSAVDAVIGGLRAMKEGLDRTTEQLGQYSAAITGAKAQAEVMQIMGDIRREAVIGNELARLELNQAKLSQAWQDLWTVFLTQVVPVLNVALEWYIKTFNIKGDDNPAGDIIKARNEAMRTVREKLDRWTEAVSWPEIPVIRKPLG